MRMKLFPIVVMGLILWGLGGCAARPQGITLLGETYQSGKERKQELPDPALAEFFKLIKKGDSELSRGKAEEALKTFQQAAGKNPRHWMAHQRIGNALAVLGRPDEAFQSLEKANALLARAITHMNLMFLYLEKGNGQAAIFHGKRAVELEPKTWQTHSGLGQCQLRLRNYDEAIAAFRKSNSIKETSQNYVGIGWADFGKKKFAEALKSFEKAATMDPAEVATLYEANARIQHENGQLEMAIEFMTKAVDSASNERTKATLKNDLVDFYLENGDYQKASYLMGKKNWIGATLSKGALGFNIVRVIKNGPADLAGIRPGDVFVEFEGQPLADVELNRFVKEMIGGSLFGGTVKLKIERQGQYLEKDVVVGISPDLSRLAQAASSGMPVGRPDGLATSSQAASRQDTVPVKPEAEENSGVSAASPSSLTEDAGWKAQSPAIRIESLTVNPSPVPAKGDFSIDIQFIASAPSGPPDLSLTLNCLIYHMGKKLFEPPADSFKAPNGKFFDVHKKLSAGPQSGKYSLRIRLSWESVSAEKSVDFTIE